MSKLLDKAKEFLTKRDHSVDKGLNKAGEQADQRTDQKYTEHIDKGVQEAKKHTGEGDTTR
ncbi:antitoxin [Dactylosporangium sp. NPDC000555]|uniref:antitoxin n=1 Tax=Dactylosporangium sp. NPDC000555 TaxID=3154260 RepID=UPI0033229196